MRYNKITRFDTSNGPGIRTVFWVSGCNHHCKGCHNPETWNPNEGHEFNSSTLCEILDSLDSPHIRGLTFSGGDPLYPGNIEIVTKIAQTVKYIYPNKDIWLWTGYLYDEVKDLSIMKYIDVLVDGPFILDKRDITQPYHGSSNQRVIDMKKTIESGQMILYCD